MAIQTDACEVRGNQNTPRKCRRLPGGEGSGLMHLVKTRSGFTATYLRYNVTNNPTLKKINQGIDPGTKSLSGAALLEESAVPTCCKYPTYLNEQLWSH